MILKELKRYIENELKGTYNSLENESIAFIIIEELLSVSRTQVVLNLNQEINLNDIKKIELIINRVKKGEPIQYILGKTEFYDLIFNVTESTLIPRQETELLVDKIIKQNSTKKDLIILDIGTGSGCIAISLAKNLINANVTAIDISEDALEIAKKNAVNNNIDVNFIKNDILNPKPKLAIKFDIIVSNPPYVTELEKICMHKNVLNYEPELALFVTNKNPLKFYITICIFATHNLRSGGQIWFEINEQYAYEMAGLLKKYNFINIEIIKDLNDKNRIITGILQ